MKQDAYTYDYTGGEQTFTAPCNGYYKLEVWGAAGGDVDSTTGGYGGYSIGITALENGNALYINVGGRGSNGGNGTYSGGYNGGGAKSVKINDVNTFGSGGGGATHIATISGQLKKSIRL